MSAPKVLFVGKGSTGVCWYRCALPAMHVGADWIGVLREPDNLYVMTGEAGGRPVPVERFFEYDIVVLQQVRGSKWLELIRKLQAAGVTVLFETDDYLHALRKKEDHDFKEHFTAEMLRELDLAMAACDGLIVSTDFLARRYKKPGQPVYVCRNGIDLSRYALTRPAHEGVVVGWAGGTGHQNAVVPWLNELDNLMTERAHVRFISVGQPFGTLLEGKYGRQRALSIPFGMIENYPAAMTMFDIALAPGGTTNFYRAKSDLRWLESSALGIPLIADPTVYPDIEHGVTGFHAETAAEAGELMRTLVADEALRRRVGDQAREFVIANRSMHVAAQQWRDVFAQVADGAALTTAA
jgi:glycosyltransferase involved in cell wall biosynthesis